MKRMIAALLTFALILPMAIGGMTLPASASAPADGKYVITGGGTVGAPSYALNTTTYTGAELGTMLASPEAADSGVTFHTDGTAEAGVENYVVTLKKIADGDYVIQLNNGNYLAVGGVTSLVSYTKYEGVPEAHWNIDNSNGVWTIKNTGDPDDPDVPDKYLGFSESAHYFRTFSSASDGIKPVLYQFVAAQTGGDTHEVSLQHSVQSTGTGSITATCSGTQHSHSENAAAPTVFSVPDGGRMTLFFEPSEGSSLSKVRVNGIETDAVPSGDGCYSLTVSSIDANTFVTAVWVTGEIGNQSGVTTKVENAPYNNTTYDLKGTASSDPLSVANVTGTILEGSVFTDKSVQYNEDSGSFTDTLSLNSVAYETSTSGSVVIPMDVVVVLDISGSMNFGTTTGNSNRMTEVANGLNDLFASLIEDSKNTRIGLVTYSGNSANGAAGVGHNNATAILPLASYESIELTYTNQNTSSGSGISYKGEISLNAVGAEGVENAHSTQTVIGGTFTQTGIAEGYKMLADLGDDREVTLNGQTYCRTPVFILVTDGCPTWGNADYTSTTIDASTYGDGTQTYDTNSNSDIANSAYYSILAQQYFSRAMKTLYNNNERARYYTIGIDTSADKTYTGAQDFPKVTGAVLNPTDSAVEALSTVTDSTKFEYKLYRKMIASEYKDQYFKDGHYVSYADASYDVTTGTDELEKAFKTIRDEVQTLVAHVMPVVENSTVKFYDALGEDMELKSAPVLTYNETPYSPTSETSSEGKTFYHYSGTVQAFAGGPGVELSEMVVTKEQDANGIWIVRWEVPSALVPAYIYDDEADNYTAAPTALLSYEVGPTDAALSAISGTRTFYSNYYDEDGYHAYSTYGLNPDSPYYKTYYGSLNPTLIVSKPENTTGTDSYSGYTTHDNGTLTKLLGNNGVMTVSSNSTDITAKKLWKNPDGTLCDAPAGASVTAQLWRSGGGQEDTMIREVSLNAANEWQYKWEDLPMRSGDQTYTYFGRETAVSGADAYDYSTVEAPDSTGELHISNYRNRMTVTVNTDWYYNGDKETDTYENRTVNTLYYLDSDGTPVPVSSVEPIIFDSTGDASEDWNDSWTDLPIRNADGTPIEYMVAQEIINEDLRGVHTTFYTVDTGARASECEAVTGIENPNPVVQIDNHLDNPPIAVTVQKVWADDSGSGQADITVFLYRSDTAEADGKLIQTATFGKAENWSHTFDELSSGYYYYVREARVSGYGTEYPDGSVCLAEDGSEPTVRVINTPYPTTGITVEKFWQTDSGTTLLDAGNMLPVQANVRQIDQAVTEPPSYTVTFRFIGHIYNTSTYRMIAGDIPIDVTAGASVTLNFTSFNGLRQYGTTNRVSVMMSSGEGTLNSSSFTHTIGGTSSYRTMTYGGSLSVSDVRSDVLITVTNENVYSSTNNFTNTGTSYTTTGGDEPTSETSEKLYQTVTLSADNGWYVNLEDLPTVSVSEDGYTTHNYSYYVEEQGSSYDPVYIGNDAENGITEGTVQIVNTVYPEILPDTVVFDFGLPMDVEVLENDRKSLNISGVTLTGVSTAAPNGVALNTGVSTAKQFSSSCKGTYGSFSVLNDKVRYIPATTDVPGIDTVYYEIFVPGVGYMYSRLDVAPATNVYFEESFLANSGYGTDGTADSRVQSDRNVLYGNDTAYDVYEQNSLGRCYAVSVNDPNRIPEATFTFTGTGFDIISRSTPDSGVMVVEVHQDNADGATVRYFITDNYLAEDSLYQLPVVHCTDLSYGTYYVRVRAYYNAIFDHSLASTRRVPDMSRVLSDLGWQADAEYIYSPAAASGEGSTRSAVRAVANAASGSYNVYVDGVRIYNPLGKSPSGVGGTLYGAAGETDPAYIQIRSVLLDAGSWDSAGGGIVNPVMYIADKTSSNAPSDAFITNGVYLSTNGVLRTEEADDGHTYLIDTEGSRIQYNECDVYTVIDAEGVRRYYADETELTKAQLNTLDLCYYDNIYRAKGPENEAYLTNGNGIAFAVESNTGVHISAKSPNGSPVTLCVYDGTRWVEIATITSASEMFYDLTPYTRGSGNIIVKCVADGDGILSLCQIKRIPPVSTRRAASREATQAEVVSAAMHALDDGDMIRADHTHIWEKTSDTATCTDRGTATFTCTVCENTRTVNSPAHGHTYAMELTPVVGCIADGELVFTCTVCGESITRVLPRERHTYTQQTVEPTDGKPGYTLYTCTCCGFSFRATKTAATPDFAELKIASAYLRLDEDIDVIFSAEVPKDCTDAYMTFSFNGKDTTVTEYTVDAEGRYGFAFTGVTPQFMGEAISASLYASKDGEAYVDTLASYSVRDYCTNVMTRYPDNAKLQTLLSDLLVYGAAAQIYTDENTDALVTGGLDLTPSEFPEQPDYSPISFSGEPDADTDWTAAGLVLSNNLAIRFTFRTASVDGLSIQTELNGRSQTFTAENFVPVSGKENTWYVTVRGICATEFADTVSASFFRDGAKIGQTVGYSVNTYIGTAFGNAAVPALAQLVKALYNYGCSAKAYIN